MSFADLWDPLLPLGRDPGTGGYRRYSFTAADAACREWFCDNASQRSLRLQTDRNGNLWAHWDVPVGWPSDSTIVTGSHLDSVPDGGAYDGPLGVVSGFAAIDLLRARGFVPARPIAIAAFCEEEGGRFGVACLGSRLLTGVLAPQAALELRDSGGTSLAEAMVGAGLDPGRLGADEELLDSIGAFVELHIEQGSALDGLGAAVGIAEGIWPHGRWRLDFTGRADHAGTTRLADRRDPMLPYAADGARGPAGGGLARRAGHVRQGQWPSRAPPTRSARRYAPGWTRAPRTRRRCTAWWPDRGRRTCRRGRSGRRGQRCAWSRSRRGWSSTPGCGPGWPGRWPPAGSPRRCCRPGPATTPGSWRPGCPTAMLFVRNPTGVSHSPAEHADPADCEAGVVALAAVLEELAGR